MKLQFFNIAPAIPAKLAFLETLSRNMWWTWNTDAIELFRRINPHLWRQVNHNPLTFLGAVPQKRLEATRSRVDRTSKRSASRATTGTMPRAIPTARPTSRWNLESMRASASTPGAWECWRGII